MRAIVIVLLTACWLGGASAQTWNDRSDAPSGATQAGEDRAQQLIDELRGLADQAEKDRAADWRFIRDLRALADRYDRPWRVELLSDDFRDGDFTQGTRWTVASGSWLVDRSIGLHSVIAPPKEAPPPAETQPKEQQQKSSKGDRASALLGAILQEAMKPQQGSSGSGETGTTAPAPPPEPDRAEIWVARTITNAFLLDLELTSWQEQGRLEIRLLESTSGEAGYRLVYMPGAQSGLQLLRTSGYGSSVIDLRREPVKLEDRRFHRLQWSRGRDGEMVVMLDGVEVMRAPDRAFMGEFAGIAIANLGGDYGVREIRVLGTEGR